MSEPINASRVWLEREVVEFAKSLRPGSRILDAGSGIQPYRHLFSEHAYEAADFEQVDKGYGSTDYVCDLQTIPVEADRYDAILFTQVMEHLSEPSAVVRELYRILKPGGTILYTAPLYYEEHELPYDFFRYTQFGVRHIFRSSGFEVGEISWLEGYLCTLAYQVDVASRSLPRSSAEFGGGKLGILLASATAIFMPIAPYLIKWLHTADTRRKHTATGHPKNYVAVMRKPIF